MKLNEFKIQFDMTIRGSNIRIPLTANVELHHSDPYYVLRDIEILPQPGQPTGSVFIKELRIQKKRDGNEYIWVHCDTGRDSDLSRSAGQSIEQHPDAE